MENRIIEIAQKKARYRSAKSYPATSGAGGHKPLFSGPPGQQAMAIRFPPDIRPEKRAVGTTTLAFVLAAPAVEIEAPPAKQAKSPPRRKAATRKKPRSKAKPAKNATAKVAAKTKSPKPKAKVAAKSVDVPLPAPPAPVTPVPDLEPPYIPPVLKTPAPMPDAPTPLPRARAVAVYRKNGLFDVIGYWLRTGWSGLTAGLRPRQKPNKPNVAQVLAENDALRREVDRLRADLARAPR